MHNVAYHRIERIAGSVITLRAEGVANQELAQVTSSFGTSLARVIRIDGDMVDLQVFAGARGISTDSEVRFLGEPMKVPYSEALLGRVFNGAGKPRDNGPEVDGERITIGGPSVNPAKRIIPKTMVRTGISTCSTRSWFRRSSRFSPLPVNLTMNFWPALPCRPKWT